MSNYSDLEYISVTQVNGPLVVVDKIRNVGYNELVEIRNSAEDLRLGQVLEVSEKQAVVQVLEGTGGLRAQGTSARFLGKPLTLPVGKEMLGRVFDGIGRPVDGGPPTLHGTAHDINGEPINPCSRA